MLRQICVYCGSSAGSRPVYREAAHRTGELLARRKIGLVYGGGDVGLMGVVADACLAAGGEVIGVMPQALVEREIAHQGLTRLHIVRSMHERKALMADLSDGFLALPGAWGTLDELCEALTWAQLRIHGKPCGLLNVEGYFNGLLAFADHAVREGFLKPVHRGLLLSGTDPEALIATLLTARVPAADKWIER